MRTMLSLAAVALATALSSAALAADAAPAPAATIDLGVDVSDVTRTVAGVHDYLAALSPAVRNAVLQACDAYSYTLDPRSADDRKTLAFCGVALIGS
jgi:hypothetical protein